MEIGLSLSIVAHQNRPTIEDPDFSVSNLALEAGGDLLLESGDFILLE